MAVSDIANVVGDGVRNELLLFAAVGLLIGGADDLLFDLLYWARRAWRHFTIYSRFGRMTADRLPSARDRGTMAIFVPAWDESAVIGRMLTHCLRQWADEDMHIFVGVYANDWATVQAVRDVAAVADGRLTVVINPLPGPTTKADCLNALWRALLRWELARGTPARAIVLHDAEDVVHADALRVMSNLIGRFALIQLPVLPLPVDGKARGVFAPWIAGHYCDEFAEQHGKALMVREALGAALPSAGVGCALSRAAMSAVAAVRGSRPFDPASLTEDYELGLMIGAQGGRSAMVRMRDATGALVATHEYFPDTIAGAVRQKARWTVGIALAGWDRLGWGHSPAEAWMRLRDRRAPLAAIVLAAAYAGFVWAMLWAGLSALGVVQAGPLPDPLPLLLAINFALLGWRFAMRALFVHRAYGLAEALRSVPRMIMSNILAMMAARRAVAIYWRLCRGEALHWDKTQHRFPDLAQEGAA